MEDLDRMTIRPLKPGDYSQLISLWARCGLPSRPHGRDSKEHIRTELSRETSSFLVAFDRANDLIGSVFATHDGRKGWINRLAVDPRWRRQGVAQALILEAETRLHESGIEIIGCLIEDGNVASEALFGAVGYVRHNDIHYYTKRSRPDI